MGHDVIEGDGVVLRPTSDADFTFLRGFLTVDPDVSNARGVNFRTRVGFTPRRVVDERGREIYVLMEWPFPESA